MRARRRRALGGGWIIDASLACKCWGIDECNRYSESESVGCCFFLSYRISVYLADTVRLGVMTIISLFIPFSNRTSVSKLPESGAANHSHLTSCALAVADRFFLDPSSRSSTHTFTQNTTEQDTPFVMHI